MLNKREEEILKTIKGDEKSKISSLEVTISDEISDSAKVISKEKNISHEDAVLLLIVEEGMSKKRLTAQQKNPDLLIFDIFDMYRVEEIIEELSAAEKSALIVTLGEEKGPVLVPVNVYEKWMNTYGLLSKPE